jgi:putative ABC transport system permease protein
MLMHLIKPLWKRKFKNLLLSMEIFLTFIVVFFLLVIALKLNYLSQLPIGFEYQSVWSIELSPPRTNGVESVDVKNAKKALVEQMQRSLLSSQEVEKVAQMNYAPYSRSTWESDFYLIDSNAKFSVDYMEMSDGAKDVLSLKMGEGRWFSNEDEGAAYETIVVNRELANLMFPGQAVLGKMISNESADKKKRDGSSSTDSNRKLLKIVGVIENFRNKGEHMNPIPLIIQRHSLRSSNDMLDVLLIKLRANTPRDYEEKLAQQLKQLRNDWSFEIIPLNELRQSRLSEDLIPLKILTLLAVFLMLMVGFGLFGVLWQNTMKRIPEIGLRRAVGASSQDIYKQIILEQLLLSSMAILVALVLLVQLPLTGVMREYLDWPIFIWSSILTTLIIYGLSILCSLYPAWRASRLSPSEALHCE